MFKRLLSALTGSNNPPRGLLALSATIALLAFSPAQAAEQILPVPGEGWHIRLDAPPLTPAAVTFGSVYSGSAGRLQLSFFVSAHASIASPTKDDITLLVAVMNSIVIEDDAPAGK